MKLELMSKFIIYQSLVFGTINLAIAMLTDITFEQLKFQFAAAGGGFLSALFFGVVKLVRQYKNL